jgi:hypothetical protein
MISEKNDLLLGSSGSSNTKQKRGKKKKKERTRYIILTNCFLQQSFANLPRAKITGNKELALRKCLSTEEEAQACAIYFQSHRATCREQDSLDFLLQYSRLV